jgi:hypothetical protein
MPTVWRDSADAFANTLRRHGVEPDAVTNVEAAWCAFVEFLQLDIEDIEPADEDGDGFIVQWGRWSWNDHRPSLSMTRQLAVVDASSKDAYDYQPELWQIVLTMLFDDRPELQRLEPPETSDTDFRFEPIGPMRSAALAEIHEQAQRHALVRALWAMRPASSQLTLESVD